MGEVGFFLGEREILSTHMPQPSNPPPAPTPGPHPHLSQHTPSTFPLVLTQPRPQPSPSPNHHNMSASTSLPSGYNPGLIELTQADALAADARAREYDRDWAVTGYGASWLLERYAGQAAWHKAAESGAHFPPLSTLLAGLYGPEDARLPPAAVRAIMAVINAATEPLMTRESLKVFHLNCAVEGTPLEGTVNPAECAMTYTPASGVTITGPDGMVYESPASPTVSQFDHLLGSTDGSDSEAPDTPGPDSGFDELTPPTGIPHEIQPPHKRRRVQLSTSRRLLGAAADAAVLASKR